jgi:ubiquinone/menaquinone biosynthesis C-methylase UbiE
MAEFDQKEEWSDVAIARRSGLAEFLVPMYQSLLSATEVTEADKLLDAGCGSGELSALALERGIATTGIDIAPGMIELCLADPALADGDFTEADLEDLPFEDSTFDVAIAAMSVHFCKTPLNALKELHRVIKEGGRLGMAAPASYRTAAIPFLIAKDHLPPDEAFEIMRPFTFAPEGVLAGKLAEAGFQDYAERTIIVELKDDSFEELFEMLKNSVAPVRKAIKIIGEEAFLVEYQDRLEKAVGTRTPSVLEMDFRIATALKRPA